MTASVSAADVSDAVQKALGRSDEDLRQEIDVTGRWTAAIDEIRTLLQHDPGEHGAQAAYRPGRTADLPDLPATGL